jgi:proteasome lid subunit RPN8/RPN11
MEVRVHRNQLNWFRRKARKYYPNEIAAYLLGKRIHTGLVEVYRFVYPHLEISTPGECKIAAEEAERFYEFAKEDGLVVLGTIHSHPNYLPVMSACDLQNHKACEDVISGIVEIPKPGNEAIARVVFWRHNSSLPCKLKYF